MGFHSHSLLVFIIITSFQLCYL